MNKVKIPPKHSYLLKLIYRYLHETLGVTTDKFSNGHLAKKLLSQYQQNFEQSSNITQTPKTKTQTKLQTEPQRPTIKPRYKKETLTPSSPLDSLLQISNEVKKCKLCYLSQRRKNHIATNNNSKSKIILLTDIPDYYDEVQGHYFTDKIGELIEKILLAIGFSLKKVYQTGTIKCTSAIQLGSDITREKVCLNYLQHEIKLIKPKIIIALGELSYRMLFDSDDFNQKKGEILNYQSFPIIFIDHPREMLIDTTLKKVTWDSLKKHLPLFKSIAEELNDKI